MQVPVTFRQYLRLCCHLRPSPWPHTKFQISKNRQFPWKSQGIFNPFLGFAISYRWFIYGYSEITVSTYNVSPTRVPLAILWWVPFCLGCTKNAFTTAWSLPSGSQTLKIRSKDWCLWLCTCHCPFPLWLLMATCTLLHSTPDLSAPKTQLQCPWQRAYSTIFQWWWHYLQKALDFWLMWSPITGICNTFSTTKILTHRQARWSEYISGFNLVIHFMSWENSEPKPNALTRWWDIYLKEGNSNYASINPQNYHLVFTSQATGIVLWATTLSIPVLHGSLIMDAERLIPTSGLNSDRNPISTEHLNNQSDPKVDPWSQWFTMPPWDASMFPNSGNLQLCVLQYSHDHPLAGHFFVRRRPFIQVCMQTLLAGLPFYVKGLLQIMHHLFHAKPVVTHILQTSQQTLIPRKPWNSISMDFIEKLPPIFQLHLNSSSLLIISQSSHSSSRLTIHHVTSLAQLFSFYMSFPSMVCPKPCHFRCGTDSCPTSSGPLELHLDMKLNFTSWISSQKWWTKLNKLIRLWNSTSESIATTTRQLVWTPSISWVHLKQILQVPLPALHPSLPKQGLLSKPHGSSRAWPWIHTHCDKVTDLDELHQQLGQHIANAQHDTNLHWFLMTTSSRIQDWSHVYSRLNSSVWNDPPRKYPLKIPWTIWKSLHSWHPFSHSSDFWTISATVQPGFPHLNVGTGNSESNPNSIQPHPHQSLLMMKPEFEISKIPFNENTCPCKHCNTGPHVGHGNEDLENFKFWFIINNWLVGGGGWKWIGNWIRSCWFPTLENGGKPGYSAEIVQKVREWLNGCQGVQGFSYGPRNLKDIFLEGHFIQKNWALM